ncbi:hypothetical protein ACQEVS_15130 [Streptomyces sp. CA-181903]|uniref:hypothetical protein n=1 Tax=Streptomyces sp. CA-181903 TaxID=3240055 RepID=UPI003D915C16
MNEIWTRVKSALDFTFGPTQFHKAGGLQAVTSSGQLLKFDPSLVKYDEKGLTIAGVQIFEHKKISLQDAFGEQVKDLKAKYPFLDGGKTKRAREEKKSTPSTEESPLGVAKEARTLAREAHARLNKQRDALKRTSTARQGASAPAPQGRRPRFSTRTARNVRDLEERVRNLESALG